MKYAAIRNAILRERSDHINKQISKKYIDFQSANGRINGIENSKKIKSLADFERIIKEREREEVKVASKGNLKEYWLYRYATIEMKHIYSLLQGALEKKNIGFREAQELDEAFGDVSVGYASEDDKCQFYRYHF